VADRGSGRQDPGEPTNPLVNPSAETAGVASTGRENIRDSSIYSSPRAPSNGNSLLIHRLSGSYRYFLILQPNDGNQI
jgi:hypothetical protein